MEKKKNIYNSQGAKLNYDQSKKLSEKQRKNYYKEKFEEMGFNFEKYSNKAQEHLLDEIISLYELLEKKSFIDNNTEKLYNISKEKCLKFCREIRGCSRKEIEKKLREEIVKTDLEEANTKKIKKTVEDSKEIMELESLLECIYRSVIRIESRERMIFLDERDKIYITNLYLKEIIDYYEDIKNEYFCNVTDRIRITIKRDTFNHGEFKRNINILENSFEGYEEILKSNEYSNINEIKSKIFYLDLTLFYIINTFYNIYFNSSILKKSKEDIYNIFLKKIEEYKIQLKNNVKKSIENSEITYDIVVFLELKFLYNKYNLKYELFSEWNKFFNNLSIEEKEKIKNTKISSEKAEILNLKHYYFETGKTKDNHYKEKLEKLEFLFKELEKSLFIFNLPKNKEFIKTLYYLIYEKSVKISSKKRIPSISIVLNNKLKNKEKLVFEKLYSNEYVEEFILVLLKNIKDESNEISFFVNILEELLNLIKIFIENLECFSIDNLKELLESLKYFEKEVDKKILEAFEETIII